MKQYVLVMSPNIVRHMLSNSLNYYCYDVFKADHECASFRSVIAYSCKNRNLCLKRLEWEEDDDYEEDITDFSLSQEEWDDENFITNKLQSVLDEKSIKTNFSYTVYGPNQLLATIKSYLNEPIRKWRGIEKGLPRIRANCKTKLFANKLAFFDDDNGFVKCVAICTHVDDCDNI